MDLYGSARGTGIVLLLLLLFQSGIASAAEKITVFSPQNAHFAGQPILYHLQTINISQPDQASVYYRSKGIKVFRRLPLNKESEVDFRALLKADKIIPPGIEYYFVIQDQAGHIFTFPQQNPQQNPYSLKIDLDTHPPHIVAAAPAAGVSLKQTDPEVKIAFKDEETQVDPKSIRLTVDQVDVTQLAKVSDTQILYRPERSLGFGKHTIAVEMMDINGNRMKPTTWGFTVFRTDKLQNAKAEVQWSGEYRQKVVKHNENQEPDWVIQSSGTLDTGLEAGDFSTSLQGNIWYTDEEGPGPTGDKANLNNYLLQTKYRQQQASLGDVSVDGTELIGQSFSRRGGIIELTHADTKIQTFALRSNSIIGFDHFFGIEDSNQRLLGTSITTEVLDKKGLTLKGMYIKGKNYLPTNYNTSTLESGHEGDIYSLGFASEIWGSQLRLEGEFCSSRFDSDITDTQGEQRDNAWRAEVSGGGDSYDWETGYKYIGQDFQTIVNATGANNREEWKAGFGLRALSSVFRIDFLQIGDNVDGNSLMPEIRNRTGSFTYNLAKEKWPSLFFNYTLNQQESLKEPGNFSPLKNRTQIVGAGCSMFGNRWNISPSYTYTTFRDEASGTENDSNSHVLTLAGSMRPTDNFTISPSFSYVNIYTEANDVTTETYQGTLGAIYSLFDHALDLNTTLSYLDNRSDDGSAHSTICNGIMQLNWHLEKKLLNKGTQTFSIRAQYNRSEDHLTDNVTRDYSVFAVFSFNIPVKFY